jgi:ribosomal protein L11 methyltransferase
MPPKSRSRQVITIEPGMAFGTGTHATTRGCMSFIETVTRSFHGTAFTALDVGTGSGILAIALAKLGAKKIWALDNDPVAVKVARENLEINDVESSIALSGKKLREIRKMFPLVVANLTAETIIDLAADLFRRVAPKGFLVLSGILNSKAAGVIHRLAPDGFRVVRRRKEKEWTTLLLRRK